MVWFKYNINDMDERLYEQWYACLSEDRHDRVDSFSELKRKKMTVCGEMLVRLALVRLDGTLSDLAILIDDHGKPYVDGCNYSFNVSHSGDMVVCVVDDKPVGIDVEQIRPLDFKVIERICSENEKKYIYSGDDELQRFFEIWTAKEAHFKRLGTGIACDLRLYDTLLADDIVRIEIGEGYTCAISKTE